MLAREEKLLTMLEAERAWEHEGFTVLTAAAQLPQLTLSTRRARRFNRYYRRMLRAYFLYCEQELLPYARRSCAAALERSVPFDCVHASLRSTVTLQTGSLLSLYLDIQQSAPRLTMRRADTWDLAAMLPLPLSELFPPHARCRALLLRFARSEAAARMERGEALYHPDYRSALRRTLSLRNYYLSPDGLHFFYPMYAFSDAREGIVGFTLPYDGDSGPFLPPEA